MLGRPDRTFSPRASEAGRPACDIGTLEALPRLADDNPGADDGGGEPVSDEDELFEKNLRLDLPRGRSARPKTGSLDRGLQARWLTPEEMTGDVWNPEGGILLGKRAGRLIGWNDNRHMLTIGGSRAGKGVSLIVPNLTFYPGSALVIDPKGENARITAGRRGQGTKEGGPGLGQKVHVIDPFEVSGRLPVASFNPLSELNIRSSDVAEDAASFADALIEHPESGERHWTESAQALLRALILVALAERQPSRRNLVTVRRLLTLTDRRLKLMQAEEKKQDNPEISRFDALLKLLRAQKGRWHSEICAGVAEQLDTMGPEELGSVLSTARTQTRWLDDRRMHRVLTRSDFSMEDLKLERTTIYLCLPATRMGTHSRWLRLVIMLALAVMERTDAGVPAPVLFVLDEFAVLGHMHSIEMGAGLMAGFDVKLWPILQDVAQLQRHYERTWQTFVANSGVVTAFGVSDHQTAKALSERLGKLRMMEQVASDASARDRLSGAPAFKEQHFQTPLLAENEIERVFDREKKRMLVLGAGFEPLVAERLIYFEDEMFKGLYDDPRRRKRRKRRGDGNQIRQ
jgi:type IV secretion system protein VirD4